MKVHNYVLYIETETASSETEDVFWAESCVSCFYRSH